MRNGGDGGGEGKGERSVDVEVERDMMSEDVSRMLPHAGSSREGEACDTCRSTTQHGYERTFVARPVHVLLSSQAGEVYAASHEWQCIHPAMTTCVCFVHACQHSTHTDTALRLKQALVSHTILGNCCQNATLVNACAACVCGDAVMLMSVDAGA